MFLEESHGFGQTECTQAGSPNAQEPGSEGNRGRPLMAKDLSHRLKNMVGTEAYEMKQWEHLS